MTLLKHKKDDISLYKWYCTRRLVSAGERDRKGFGLLQRSCRLRCTKVYENVPLELLQSDGYFPPPRAVVWYGYGSGAERVFKKVGGAEVEYVQ
jgi:hypothetical protein